MRRFARHSSLVVLVLCVWGCPASEPEGPIRVDDPQRVVALAPSVVELMFALDLGDRLVGVGDYCEFPPEAARKKKLGGLFDPDLEGITRLEPDLAILLPSEEVLRRHLDTLGIEVLPVSSESLEDIGSGAMTLAERFGVPERGETFVSEWTAALAPAPLRRSPRVLLAVARERGTLADTLAAGPGTFYDELLTRMGAVNVFGDADSLYPQANLEEVMQRLPDAIIDLQPDAPRPRVSQALREDWSPLAGVPALEKGCHAVVGGDHVMLPGPRLPRLYAELREALEQCGF